MQKVAKCFLHFLNHCTLDKPSVRCQVISQDEAVLYKVNYTRYFLSFDSINRERRWNSVPSIIIRVCFNRWLIFCHMPMFCSSLPHYETTLVFGRTLLRSIFRSESKKLLDRCQADKDKFTDEQKTLFLHLPKYSFHPFFIRRNYLPIVDDRILFLNPPHFVCLVNQIFDYVGRWRVRW